MDEFPKLLESILEACLKHILIINL